MVFEFNSSEGLGLMEMIAQLSGRTIENDVLQLPETIGKGYIKRIKLGPLMSILIHQYELAVEVSGKRLATKSRSDVITFSFRNVVNPQRGVDNRGQSVQLFPSVQVSSADMDLDLSFPIHAKINTIIVSVHVDLLKELINRDDEGVALKNIISGTQPYLYEEIVSAEMQEIASKIISASAPAELQDFYYRVKVEELIYLFFTELIKRENTSHYPVNVADVKLIYSIRDNVISDLSKPPNLPELTHVSGVSESKLNRLFKQIFGNTIYNYHQRLRINEAAYLLKNKGLSVSEAGYQMGFTNLSHFTRIFERYMGMKPKRYSSMN